MLCSRRWPARTADVTRSSGTRLISPEPLAPFRRDMVTVTAGHRGGRKSSVRGVASGSRAEGAGAAAAGGDTSIWAGGRELRGRHGLPISGKPRMRPNSAFWRGSRKPRTCPATLSGHATFNRLRQMLANSGGSWEAGSQTSTVAANARPCTAPIGRSGQF